jgi:hypothetical protein
MSIDDERELRLRLDSALEGITPSPAPVPAILRRGRTIRIRRRVGVVAGLAAAVGVALAAPGLVHLIVRQTPEISNEQKWVLSVYPPGPHAAPGLIAWGTINGKRWDISVTSSSGDVLHVGPWGYCSAITLFGGPSDLCQSARSRVVAGNSPSGSVGTPPSGAVIEGYASPSVAYVVGVLSDGRTIRARATDVGGQKFWACAVPRGQLLRRVVFYSASGRQVAAQSGARYA